MAEEQSRQAANHHREELDAMERAAEQQAEQAAQQAELLERQTEAIEQAAFAAEIAAAEAAEQHRQTTANAWRLQSEAKSERAYALCRSGMFDEAYRLAVQSIEQDPGNLDAFLVAASSLLSLRQADRAKRYLEKQIQILNLPDYRQSPRYFVQVLELLSTQSDLFQLGGAFSSALRTNVNCWRESPDSVREARNLLDILVRLGMFPEAECVFELIVIAGGLSRKTLSTALTLLKILIASGDSATANKVVDLLSPMSHGLFAECYLCEMYSLVGRDGRGRVDAFLKNAPIDSRRAVESDVAQIRQVAEKGELSQDTIAFVMQSVSEKYCQWKSAIEAQLCDTTVASAKSAPVKTGGAGCGVLSFFVLTLASVVYCFSKGFRPESAGPYFPFGVLFGAILVGSLYGRYMKRRRIAQGIRKALTVVFTEENRRLGELALPPLTPPVGSSGSPSLFEIPIYIGIIIGYIVVWFSLMAGQGKPSTVRNVDNTAFAPKDTAVFVDELANASVGSTYGISWTNGIGNHGAVFRATDASRIEYAGRIPREGTVEFWIKVDSGYQYQDYAFTGNLDNAMIFSTDAEGGDVTWPGTTKFFVSRDGNVSLFVANNKYNNPPTTPIQAQGTAFRFGEWHAIGFSVGRLGQFIMIDGKVAAAARNRTQEMSSAGTHQSPADVPTLGETVSHFWPRHRYEGGFEGIVARFRASPKQRDWDLARGIGD